MNMGGGWAPSVKSLPIMLVYSCYLNFGKWSKSSKLILTYILTLGISMYHVCIIQPGLHETPISKRMNLMHFISAFLPVY